MMLRTELPVQRNATFASFYSEHCRLRDDLIRPTGQAIFRILITLRAASDQRLGDRAANFCPALTTVFHQEKNESLYRVVIDPVTDMPALALAPDQPRP